MRVTDYRCSRRGLLRRLGLLGSALLFAPLAARSMAETHPAKASKAAVHYQDHPNQGRTCGMCKYFIMPAGGMDGGMMGQMGPMQGRHMMAPGHCRLVAGRISPMGYCDLYTARA